MSFYIKLEERIFQHSVMYSYNVRNLLGHIYIIIYCLVNVGFLFCCLFVKALLRLHTHSMAFITFHNSYSCLETTEPRFYFLHSCPHCSFTCFW
ncbi:hypothetical protein EB796_018378 [Bugula neritina]|uniref:Uncharacterized protein n=1 Tax=Bugula neritina TaxID=10212 RepID=A0A7J7JCJ9_BUGNE|nr:hypothetical protein EB796_018378 [Bugula neritina]